MRPRHRTSVPLCTCQQHATDDSGPLVPLLFPAEECSSAPCRSPVPRAPTRFRRISRGYETASPPRGMVTRASGSRDWLLNTSLVPAHMTWGQATACSALLAPTAPAPVVSDSFRLLETRRGAAGSEHRDGSKQCPLTRTNSSRFGATQTPNSTGMTPYTGGLDVTELRTNISRPGTVGAD